MESLNVNTGDLLTGDQFFWECWFITLGYESVVQKKSEIFTSRTRITWQKTSQFRFDWSLEGTCWWEIFFLPVWNFLSLSKKKKLTKNCVLMRNFCILNLFLLDIGVRSYLISHISLWTIPFQIFSVNTIKTKLSNYILLEKICQFLMKMCKYFFSSQLIFPITISL